MNLSAQVLVITGSDGVLGRADAAILSVYGSKLALLAHGNSPTPGQPPGSRYYGGIDLTQEDATRSVMARIVDEAGRLDGLINIAGGFPWGKVSGGPLHAWGSM